MFKTSLSSRRGFSLIEVVVVITAGAALFAVAIVVFERFLSARSAGQDHFERTMQTARLAEQFRRDVWAASNQQADFAGKTDQLILDQAEGRRIEYQIVDDHDVRRTCFLADEQPTRETFSFPADTHVHFEYGEKSVSVVVAPPKSRPVEGESSQGKPLQIVGMLGRDQRFDVTPSAAEAGGSP